MLVTWSPDPIIGSWWVFTLRWYGLFFALSFVGGGVLGNWILKRESKPPESLDSIMIHMMVGTLVGARLGHCLFYDPMYYLSNPLEIIKIWEGGLASHGAALGVMIAIYLYSRKAVDQPFLWLLDRVGIPAVLGCSLIRLGNLFNSEIIGMPTGSDWGFIFSRIDSIPRHPTQIYESFAYFLIFLFLLVVYLKWDKARYHGVLSGLTLMTLLPTRSAIEFFKEDQSYFEAGWVLNMGQLLSIPMFVLGVVFFLKAKPPEALNKT